MQIVVLGVMRPEMTIDFGSKEVELMLDEGVSMDSPCAVWGLLKQFGLVVGLKLSMCCLECVCKELLMHEI